ncbi:anti-sigma factor family protein [Alteromonas stellipolaris]|uniref:Anti-sigma factor n=2 Tax=Alteromonas stellipolaris TaxID=233316 RepID=A0AAW7Z340_9ALTE|nr:anti-sigma factor [Alteromonas stellipolaris]MDO6533663.1 anti-sigma factor [Alteromonas stellipolaris]MDO6576893.1 anti-sigma factor [Alteromonas stellipolaris]MDO6625343.1 anti-sigma factor [Alteromonas stellipolaris]
MTISDEMLSAFLDAELSDEDMEYVRASIASDLALSDRLASLAQVDMMVKAAADAATQKPLPNSVVAMLADDVSSEAYLEQADFDSDHVSSSHAGERIPRNVTSLNRKPKESRRSGKWKVPLSLAAGVALVAGLTWMQSEQTAPLDPASTSSTNSHWANVSKALDNNLTGEMMVTDAGMEIVPQLSFMNNQSQLCRQAQIQGEDELNIMIACKNGQGIWQLHASKLITAGRDKSEYQTASANKVLDEEIGLLMVSTPLNREQEKQAINHGWQSKAAEGVVNEN